MNRFTLPSHRSENKKTKRNTMNLLNKKSIALSALVAVAVVSAPVAHAALTATSTLSQTINNGTASTDIRDAGGSVLVTPTISMNSVTLSTSQQTSTGTFGSSSQRITVDNPGGAPNGFTLALNASVPGTGNWVSGGNNYAYNGNATTGQLSVNPTVGTITAVVGGATGIALGTSGSFTASTPITLVNAAAGSADIWNGYFTGIGLSQAIPANQPAGTYTLSMTQTLTVL